VFDASAQKNSRTTHLKVNVDENPHLAEHFSVSSIPTTVFIRDSIVVGSVPGALNARRLDDLLIQTYALDMAQVRKAADAG
jgi:thioredoxin-like negative regulator of GroEL